MTNKSRVEKKFLLKNTNYFFQYLNKNSYSSLYKDRNILSIYYDNDTLESLNDAEEGTRPRKKIRLRKYLNIGYNNFPSTLNNFFDEKFILEKKITTFSSNFKTKQSVIFGQKFLTLNDDQYRIMKPVSLVFYSRKYFGTKTDRVTFDFNIKFFKLDNKNNIRLNKLENNYIVEFKSSDQNFFGSWNKINFLSTRYSKYISSLKI